VQREDERSLLSWVPTADPPLVASEPIEIVRGPHGWHATLPARASAVWRVPR
jgi:hypothetical protein